MSSNIDRRLILSSLYMFHMCCAKHIWERGGYWDLLEDICFTSVKNLETPDSTELCGLAEVACSLLLERRATFFLKALGETSALQDNTYIFRINPYLPLLPTTNTKAKSQHAQGSSGHSFMIQDRTLWQGSQETILTCCSWKYGESNGPYCVK